METREEFKKLMEEICDIVFRETAIPKGSKFEIPLITKNVLHMLMNLNHQIEEQREEIKRFEEHITKLDEKIKLLIKELKTLGYLNIKERRKPLRRTIVTQEAFTNLLRSKGIITRKELLDEIKQLLKKNY
jgi:3-methyladenine DNA glycosylase/8-oxoguanine DNA glycosylase